MSPPGVESAKFGWNRRKPEREGSVKDQRRIREGSLTDQLTGSIFLKTYRFQAAKVTKIDNDLTKVQAIERK